MSIDTSAFKKNMPIETDRLTISFLDHSDISWYKEEIIKPYYLKYLDAKEKMLKNAKSVAPKLTALAFAYKHGLPETQIRLIARDKKTNEVYGGITIFDLKQDTKTIELGYWIKPEFQGNGYATEMINAIYNFIEANFKNCIGIVLEIQVVNTQSVKLAERCGFRENGRRNGKYCTNVIYSKYFTNRGEQDANQIYYI